MTPGEFIAKWRASELKERSAAQEHYIDLCRLLGEPTPAEADPTGESYCFEKGAALGSGLVCPYFAVGSPIPSATNVSCYASPVNHLRTRTVGPPAEYHSVKQIGGASTRR